VAEAKEEETKEEDTKAFLARYTADRAHELELEKVSAQYELRFIQAAGILNGASATVFLSFLGSTIDKLEMSSALWIASVLIWLLGLIGAVVAGASAYKSQEKFVDSRRSRRNAAGLRVMRSSYRTTFSIGPEATPEVLDDKANDLNRDGDKYLWFSWCIGLLSITFFGIGAGLALAVVLTANPLRPNASATRPSSVTCYFCRVGP
jgi:hypothetical protein